MRITSKGQVTIPIAIREKAGLLPNTEVEFEFDGKAVRLRPVRRKTGKLSRGAFGMTFNQALGSGNVLVSDQVKLSLDVSAVRQSA